VPSCWRPLTTISVRIDPDMASYRLPCLDLPTHREGASRLGQHRRGRLRGTRELLANDLTLTVSELWTASVRLPKSGGERASGLFAVKPAKIGH
jgi:hypothetical protein